MTPDCNNDAARCHSLQRLVSRRRTSKNKYLTPQSACGIMSVKIGNEPSPKQTKTNEANRTTAEATGSNGGNPRRRRLRPERRCTKRLHMAGKWMSNHLHPVGVKLANVAGEGNRRGNARAEDGAGKGNGRKGNRSSKVGHRRRYMGSFKGSARSNSVGWYQAPCYWHRIIGGELVTSLMNSEEIRRYLASIGSKGGKTTGASKRRGDAAYYKRISKKAAQARKRKAANAQAQRRGGGNL